jgi:UDP-N-acetylglucosamine--N-acetylmuramyl-(pentapeptide) pyrophosphoryl-undecaprenol N-acetylglucosamine transferase
MLAARHGIPFSSVRTGQVRGRSVVSAAGSLARIAAGTRDASALIRVFRPEVAFVTGGYVAAPVAVAARRAGVPLLIYLPDLVPGQSIRLTSRFARKVAVSYPESAAAFPGKAVVTGYPVRGELSAAGRDRRGSRFAMGLEEELPVVLVFGGSRGARSINRALVGALPGLLPRAQVVHITGELDWEEASAAGLAAARGPWLRRYRVFSYLHDEMPAALASADLVVSRAGASVLGEYPALGLPAILAPYPYAGQHQDANAEYLVSRGASLAIADSELSARLEPTVLDLLASPGRLSEMARCSAALARPDAAENIARELLLLAGG